MSDFFLNLKKTRIVNIDDIKVKIPSSWYASWLTKDHIYFVRERDGREVKVFNLFGDWFVVVRYYDKGSYGGRYGPHPAKVREIGKFKSFRKAIKRAEKYIQNHK